MCLCVFTACVCVCVFTACARLLLCLQFPMCATSKVQNEKDIKESKKNYVIFRLGSVYGYSSSDTMRINIMPNLFSKIASQNGTINLFAGGKQIKSVVVLYVQCHVCSGNKLSIFR